jgi:hypothetical protein
MAGTRETGGEGVDDRSDDADEAVVMGVSNGGMTVSLPPDADESEAAAIATAVGAHLTDHDRAVAAAATGSDDEGGERADPWTVAGRLKAVGKRRWPDDVARGEEWAAAARSFD